MTFYFSSFAGRLLAFYCHLTPALSSQERESLKNESYFEAV